MKLVHIIHERCGSYDSTSFVLAPDEWSNEQIEEAIDKASDAYLKFALEFSKMSKAKSPGWNPDYKNYPDKTVAQIDAEFAAAKAEYDAWHSAESKAKRGFTSYLKEAGFKTLWDEGAADVETTVYWGHQHGVGLDYEIPFPSDRKTAILKPDEEVGLRTIPATGSF